MAWNSRCGQGCGCVLWGLKQRLRGSISGLHGVGRGEGGGRGPRSRARRSSVSPSRRKSGQLRAYSRSPSSTSSLLLPLRRPMHRTAFATSLPLTLSNSAFPPSPHAPYRLRHASLSSSLHLPPHPAPPRPPLNRSDAVSAKWFSASGLDIGSDISAPLPPPGGLSRWTFLFVGGAAGVFSRTLTAPFERLKLSAQINAGGGPQVRTNECVARCVRTNTCVCHGCGYVDGCVCGRCGDGWWRSRSWE
jgi:hypothetical protein